MLPLGKWVFVAMATDTASTPQKQHGFRYTLTDTSTQKIVYGTRNPIGSYYDLDNSDSKVFIGGDDFHAKAHSVLQYVRLYLNYFPDSEDEMINLATMDTGTIFILQLEFFNSFNH